jgi:signal transduction histidine kinase
MRPSSLAVRLVLGAGIWTAAALLTTGIVLHQLFLDHVRRGFDAVLSEHLWELIAVAGIGPEGDFELHRLPIDPVFQRPGSGSYWQLDTPQGSKIRSASLGAAELDLPEIPTEAGLRFYETRGPNGERLRVAVQAVPVQGSATPARGAVAFDTAELQASVARFGRLLILSLALLGAGLLTAILAQVQFGLAPLRRMRTQLQEIRAGARQSLDSDAPREIAPFALEINALLAQVADTIDRARTHVGNLAHGLKTPLTVLRNEAERVPAPARAALQGQIEAMSRSIGHHLARARMAGAAGVLGMQTELQPVAEDILRVMRRIHGGRGLQMELRTEGRPVFPGERQDCEELLGNLLDNACIWARSQVLISLRNADGAAEIAVEDDGPGIAPEHRAIAMARGGRLDEKVPGTGLGLSIVGDLVALHGGTWSLDRSALGGLCARIRLPTARGPAPAERRVKPVAAD